jgi:hypothetical protein
MSELNSGECPTVKDWTARFGVTGLVICWSPAPAMKMLAASGGLIGIVWAATFLFFGTMVPAWWHWVFAAFMLVPPLVIGPAMWRASRQPAWLELDIPKRRLELPRAGKGVSLAEWEARFVHDYFRKPGAGRNMSEFNVELAPRGDGAVELVPLLKFAGYDEDFDKLGERLQLLGFPFKVRKHDS